MALEERREISEKRTSLHVTEKKGLVYHFSYGEKKGATLKKKKIGVRQDCKKVYSGGC